MVEPEEVVVELGADSCSYTDTLVPADHAAEAADADQAGHSCTHIDTHTAAEEGIRPAAGLEVAARLAAKSQPLPSALLPVQIYAGSTPRERLRESLLPDCAP